MLPDQQQGVELPADFEQRCIAVYSRLQIGDPMTVAHIANQLGVPYDFLATGLGVLFGAIIHSVPALVDLSPERPLH
jgi:hypothetical protein